MRLSERKHKEVEGRLDIYKDMYKEERKKNTKVNVKTQTKYPDQENGNMACHLEFVKARLKGRVISEAFFHVFSRTNKPTKLIQIYALASQKF